MAADGTENNAKKSEAFSRHLIFDGYNLPSLLDEFDEIISLVVPSHNPDEPLTNEETPTDVQANEETPIDEQTNEETPTDVQTNEETPTDVQNQDPMMSPDPVLEMCVDDSFLEEMFGPSVTSNPVNTLQTSNQNAENQVIRDGVSNPKAADVKSGTIESDRRKVVTWPKTVTTKHPIPARNEFKRFARNVTAYDQSQFKGLQQPLPPSLKFRIKTLTPNESKRMMAVKTGNPNVKKINTPMRPTSAKTEKPNPPKNNRSKSINDNSVSGAQIKTTTERVHMEAKKSDSLPNSEPNRKAADVANVQTNKFDTIKKQGRNCAPIQRYCPAEYSAYYYNQVKRKAMDAKSDGSSKCKKMKPQTSTTPVQSKTTGVEQESIRKAANAEITKSQTGSTPAATNKTSSQLVAGKCPDYQLTVPRLRSVNNKILGFTENLRLSDATLSMLATKLGTEEVEKVTTNTHSASKTKSKKDVRRKRATSEIRNERSKAAGEQVRQPSNKVNFSIKRLNVSVKTTTNSRQQGLLSSIINNTSKGEPSALKADSWSLLSQDRQRTESPASLSTDPRRERDLLYITELVREILDKQNQPTPKKSLPGKSCFRKGDVKRSPKNRKVHFALGNSFYILDYEMCRRVNFTDYYTLDSVAKTEGQNLTSEFINSILTWPTNTWFEKYARYGCIHPPLNEIRKLINYQDKKNTAIERFEQFFKEDTCVKIFKRLYKAWSSTNCVIQLSINSIRVTNDDPLTNWKIDALRKSETNSTFTEEIQDGDILIVDLRTRCVFAYVTETKGCEKTVQNITLEIRPLPSSALHLKLENLTVRVLTNIKRHIRQVQALTYLSKAPLADVLIGESNANLDREDKLEIPIEDEQKQIVSACVHDICCSQEPFLRIIDGPPGTGKTQVTVDLVKELFSKEDELPVDLKILIITSSDMAADDVCDRLKNQIQREKIKVSLLRFGDTEHIDPSIHDLTFQHLKREEESTSYDIELEAQIVKSRLNAKLLEMRSKEDVNLRIIQNLQNDYRQLCDQNEEAVAQFNSRFKEEIIFARTNVVVTSLQTCWSNNFEKFFVPSTQNEGNYHKCTICILDDAHKMKFGDLFIPIMTMVRTLILIGDSKVLHEIVNTDIANTENISTPFQRLIGKPSTAVVSFKNQYRMNSKLLTWFESYFKIKFNNTLSSNDDFILRPLAVINLMSKGTDAANFRKKMQELSKFIVINIEKLLENNDFLKIGILTEDTTQKTEIENMFRGTSKKTSVFVGNSKQFCGVQKDVIIILGFPLMWGIKLDKWMYSAMSRAKHSLIIFDNFSKVIGRNSVDDLIKKANIRRSYYTWSYDSDIKDFPFFFIKSNKKSSTKNQQ